MDANLLAEVERWIVLDTEHGAQLRDMLDDDPDQVAVLFDGRIAFGTAGLRAEMGPGPRQMNRLVVRQTTAGLMDWLPAGATVVIGYDARYNSKQFADDVAEIVLANGGVAKLIDQPAPTPVLALAVLDHAADAGVMITASHNPAADNGYKLYLSDGIQLVAPSDAEIAAAIDREAANTDTPISVSQPRADAEPVDIAASAISAHQAAAIAALTTEHRDVTVLYTAMHGVGGRHLLNSFESAGFARPAIVPEQFEPDPEFPTAPFPNPEEPGAFDLAIAAATAPGGPAFDLILANDPDADRLAVGIAGEDGQWRRLSGDEVGALLADHLLRRSQQERGTAVVASSIVSSRFINRLAEAYGAESVRTLTGFKWVARPIVERPDDRYVIGYEEALGYCIGDRVRDKDGVSAALVMAELAAECKTAGLSIQQRLDELIETHGLYATTQVTISIADLDDADRDAARQRAVQLDPADIGGIEVVEREDLSEGRHLPPTSGVVIELQDGSRIIVRPSGTEPKIKAYLEVIESPGGAENAKEARRKAELRLSDLAASVERVLA